MTNPSRAKWPRAPQPWSLWLGGLVLWLLVVSSAQAQQGASVPAPSPGDAAATARPAAAAEQAHFLATALRFEWAARQVSGELRELIRREVDARRRFIQATFDRQVETLDELQKRDRDQAITYHEQFLRKYTNDPENTPDAMFRLAELYYEDAQVEYHEAERRFEDLRQLYERGKIPELPESPVQDYGRSIALYQDLLKRFPNYRYGDATHYLLAYCQLNSGLDVEARDSLYALVQRYPQSEYAAEAWLRVGEIHFDLGEFDKAGEAYAQVMRFKDSRFFELAMYKLAWSYFQGYRYDDAIAQFKELIAHYDRKPATGDERSAQLRKEAVDYLARSLAEDDWDGDGIKDPGAGVERAFRYLSAGLPFEEDILLVYANTLFEMHERPKYLEAVEVYRHLLRRGPEQAAAPERQARIIEICDILREEKCSADARVDMARLFGPDSVWHRANRNDVRAVAAADRAIELALRQAAQGHHLRAQEWKTQARTLQDAALLDKARAEYEAAVDGYRAYLGRYPQSPYTQELTLLYAEALYWTDRFSEAADQYERLRDMPGVKPADRDVAAFSAIKSLEKHIQALVENGGLPKDPFRRDQPSAPPKASDESDRQIHRRQPEPIPAPLLRWAACADGYVKGGYGQGRDPALVPTLKYQLADVYYRYGHFDEARVRFGAIIEQHPSELVASYSAANIINSYREENDWDNVEVWAQRINAQQIGEAQGREQLLEQIRMRKVGAQFQKATDLLAEKQYAAAAETYVTLVDQNPDFADADRAMFNAALAYQQIKRYDSAARLFDRIVTEPRFQNSDLHEDALFRLSENYRRFFNFERASAGYLALATRFATSKRAPYALYRSAELVEFSGDRKRAAALFRDYLRRFPGEADAPDVHWRLVGILSDLDDRSGAEESLRTFIRTYGAAPAQSARIVEAYLRLADAAKQRQDWRSARTLYEQVLREFTARGLQPDTPAAAFPAKATFELVEMEFRRYQAIQIRGSLQQMGRAIREKQDMLFRLEKAYIDVFPFKSFDWTLAGYYRIGKIYQEFAQALYSAPPPPHLSEEDLELYQTELEDQGAKWEDVAIERYEETIRQARRLKIVNDWVKRTLEELNKYRPHDYPLFKEEKAVLTFDAFLAPDADGPLASPVIESPDEIPVDATEPAGANGGAASPSEAGPPAPAPAGEPAPGPVP